MSLVFQIPSVFHGGDDLNHALAELSWKEMAIMTAILFGITALIIIIALLVE
ncbi:hypothetical protein [Candidatus Nanohalovita haloferacivicina]|jgi:hypothetical protein|uniref:hypothetical protein n=1 Tax=Candidatus Nanohalovita haloferacivicina TaxID=2978046 RepID=UPI00325FBFBF|nr:hypothetical protein HBNXNv_0244 [Candidatus Nanohalobia archaeon BNXNv]